MHPSEMTPETRAKYEGALKRLKEMKPFEVNGKKLGEPKQSEESSIAQKLDEISAHLSTQNELLLALAASNLIDPNVGCTAQALSYRMQLIKEALYL